MKVVSQLSDDNHWLSSPLGFGIRNPDYAIDLNVVWQAIATASEADIFISFSPNPVLLSQLVIKWSD